jgi:transposase
MTRKRSSFSPEFKDEMVKLYFELASVKSLTQVARENSIGAETLRNWVKTYRAAHPVEDEPLGVSERARLRELERDVRELKLEKEFLGKAAAFFAREYR